MRFPSPPGETQRLAVPPRLEAPVTRAAAGYEDVVQLAATVCRTPMAWVTFADADGERATARFGTSLPQSPRASALGARAMLAGDDVIVVADTHADPLWVTDPLVFGDPPLRFYAGAAITTQAGVAVGAICVGDRVPRVLGPAEADALRGLARQVAGMVELRRVTRRLAEADAKLSRRATEDGLTGLATRRVIVERLDAGLREHRRTQAGLGVLFGDLDALAAVNHEHGHQAGDRLLQVVAARLQETARGSDIVARVGGDEFAVICPGAASLATLDIAAARLRCAVSLPVELGGGAMVTPRLSIGGSLAEPGDDAGGLLRRATADMHEEKRGAPVLS